MFFGFATDISVGGAFVQTHFPSAAGSDVVLRLWPSGWDEELVLAGVVRWSREGGMGVEFTSVGPREMQVIARLVARWTSGASVRSL
jgi:PilZ domain